MRAEDVKAAAFYANLFSNSYEALASRAELEKLRLYKMRPKIHALCHIVGFMEQTRINPLSVCTIVDETFMGTLKAVGRQCHGANTLLRVLQRRSVFLRLRWRLRKEKGMWMMCS